MPMHHRDPLINAVRGDPDDVIRALVGPERHDIDYVRGVYRHAPSVGLDPSVVVAQWLHETGGGASVRWNRDRNPAGIAITADDVAQPFRIATTADAVRLHLNCLYLLVMEPNEPLPFSLPGDVARWVDRVWRPHCEDAPSVRVVDDLNVRYTSRRGFPAATWAMDFDYQDELCDWGNKVFDLPDADEPWPLHKIAAVTATTVRGAVVRAGPSRWFDVVKRFAAGVPVEFRQYRAGEDILGSNIWYVVSVGGVRRYLHASGVGVSRRTVYDVHKEG